MGAAAGTASKPTREHYTTLWRSRQANSCAESAPGRHGRLRTDHASAAPPVPRRAIATGPAPAGCIRRHAPVHTSILTQTVFTGLLHTPISRSAGLATGSDSDIPPPAFAFALFTGSSGWCRWPLRWWRPARASVPPPLARARSSEPEHAYNPDAGTRAAAFPSAPRRAARR